MHPYHLYIHIWYGLNAITVLHFLIQKKLSSHKNAFVNFWVVLSVFTIVYNMRFRQLLTRSQGVSAIPKGYCAVYVGESQKKRFVIPITCLNQPCFQDLLRKTDEEFGYHHPMGGLTIHCRHDFFTNLISHLNVLWEIYWHSIVYYQSIDTRNNQQYVHFFFIFLFFCFLFQ